MVCTGSTPQVLFFAMSSDRSVVAFAFGALAGGAFAYLYTRRAFGRIPRGSATPAAPVDTAGVLAQGSVAVIIGCASGIGRAAALRCADLGMKVLMADIETAELEAVRKEAIDNGAKWTDVLAVTCDCRSEEQLEAVKREAYAKFGAVHLLMNNAAIQTNGQCGPYAHLDRWRKIIETNLWGVYLGGRTFLPSMIEQVRRARLPSGSHTCMPAMHTHGLHTHARSVMCMCGMHGWYPCVVGCHVRMHAYVYVWYAWMVSMRGGMPCAYACMCSSRAVHARS